MTSPAATPVAAGPIPTKVILPFLIVTLVWGSTWEAIRYQLGSVDPAWSLAYRFFTGSMVMFAYGLIIRAPLRFDRSAMGPVLLLSASLFFGNYVCIYQAERHVTSGVVAMFFALLVVPNAILGWFVLKHPVSRGFLIGSGIAFAGMGLLFKHELGDAVGDDRARAALGIGLTIASLMLASIGNVLQGTARVKALPPVALFAWSMFIGAGLNALFAFATSGPPTIDLHAPYLLSMLYLGVFGSALTFPLYYFVIGTIGPARAAYTGVLSPIVAMLLSTWIEDYRWSLAAVAGSALALIGLVVALRARNPAR